MTRMVTELKESIKEENSGLIVRPDKCWMFYECCSGNRWYSAIKIPKELTHGPCAGNHS